MCHHPLIKQQEGYFVVITIKSKDFLSESYDAPEIVPLLLLPLKSFHDKPLPLYDRSFSASTYITSPLVTWVLTTGILLGV